MSRLLTEATEPTLDKCVKIQIQIYYEQFNSYFLFPYERY